MTVAEHDRTSDQGTSFSQRLQLNGAGAADNRSVQFEAEAGEQVTVYAQSGGGTADRALGLYDDSWSELDRVPAYRGDSGEMLPAQTFEIDTDGTYWIASPSSGVNLYQLEIGEAADAPERPAWGDVTAPVIEETAVAEDDPARIQISYSGTVGAQGGDRARAQLLDAEGEVIDDQLDVAPGEGGTIAVTPPASGDYEVQVQLEREGEEETLSSERVLHEDFVLPLGVPEITSVLTTDVQSESAQATAQWNAVAEAESYRLAVRESGEQEFREVGESVEGTEAVIRDLTVGSSYELQVTAERGEQASSSGAFDFTVAGEVQRWDTAHAGVGSGGTVTEEEDDSLEFDLRGNNSKIADSEDGFWYHYTQIDPSTENFTLSASFTVDEDAGKDNQSGFGLIAVDDFVPGDSSARYFNSAGTMAAKYTFGADGEEGVRYGTPGAKFVHGYTEGPGTSSAARDMSDSRAFDWDYKSDYTEGSNVNPPRFEAGETYEFTLRRSNTGFHSIWEREDGEVEEVIHYDPDMLLTQDSESFSLGVFAARDIAVTVSDLDFTTIAPEDDGPAEEAPAVYVTPELSADVTSTTPKEEIEVPLVANLHGEARIFDAEGDPVTDTVRLAPGEQGLLDLRALQSGGNSFTAEFTPDEDQPQFTDRQELESTDPVELALDFTVNSYGSTGESIWVSPEGTAEGAGTKEDPLDVHTAVAYADAGQQIVLTEGTYLPEEAIVIERGRDGTEEEPITMLAEPGAQVTFDLSESEGGGIILRGDHWHLYDLEITESRGYEKPLLIQGHHNVVEKIESHHNQDTGIQISGLAEEPTEMWPSNNLVLSSESHNNADPTANDADGFAAKLTVGEGNEFRDSIAHHNIDDGWDLYAKSTEGPIGTVVIEDSVAYSNGWLEESGFDLLGEGNGFKLGGESMPGDHLLSNSISFNNLASGVTSNSGPDVRVQDVTAAGNGAVTEGREGANINLYTNAEQTGYEVGGLLSFGGGAADSIQLDQEDTSLQSDPSNFFDGVRTDDSSVEVSEAWFSSTDYSLHPQISEDGSINMGGLLELTGEAPSDTGARLSVNPDPTVIELLPPVGAEGDSGEGEQSGPPRGPGNNNGNGNGPGGNNGNGNGPSRPGHPVFGG
ncbi:fibronectin type III domain-containing protein [Nesterenkonia lutea]|uniref:Fibronectin type-III domain-containing protein n=1 Tax=Nesterenkonia lutea TaxID=272919 RepID=A0ABR9JHK4_9MICC|nr:fibronectin type III domain-containing protein [Nesterenkonia lutea]MBE1525270.1 hypothetical protein [Nesterenkonia lutea]